MTLTVGDFEIIKRLGSFVTSLLDDENFKDVVASLKEDAIRGWKDAKYPHEREAFWCDLQAVGRLEQKLKTLGQTYRAELVRMEAEKVKGQRGPCIERRRAVADPTFDDYLRRLFHIESGGNPYARTGSNRGLGQFGPAEERMFGINDSNRHLPEAQAAAVSREYAQNHPILTKALGREPTFAEHYLMHQQGIAGAPALLANPDQPAWKTLRPFYKSDAIAKSAVTGNIPRDSALYGMDPDKISGAGFTQMWLDKFNRGLPGGQGAVAAMPPGAAAVAAGVGTPPAPMAGPMPDGSTLQSAMAPPASVSTDAATRLGLAQKALDAEKETVGEKNSKAMMALAQQLMAGSQAKPAQFMPLQPANTGPMRPLPLDLPKFGSA